MMKYTIAFLFGITPALAGLSGVSFNTDREITVVDKELHIQWHELTLERQTYYKSLGWTMQIWEDQEDNGSIEELDWHELLPVTRMQLEGRGWTQERWDNQSEDEAPFREMDWVDLPSKIRKSFSTLGWTEDKWESDLTYSTRVEHASWGELTGDEREAAHTIKFNETTWDHRRFLTAFDPEVARVHFDIPELSIFNLDYFSTLDIHVQLMDGHTLGDDEECATAFMTMKEYVEKLRQGYGFYLKYEDEDPFKSHIRGIVGDKILKHLGDALRKSSLRKIGKMSDDYDNISLSDRNWSMWVGGTNTTTSMHFDSDTVNFLWVVEGRKRVVMIPHDYRTEDKYECVSSFSEHSCWTGVDILNGPLPEHAVEIELGPGDGIMIPYLSWHSVQNLEPTVAVGYRVNIYDYAEFQMK